MEALLNSLNIHHLGDNNYCSPLDSPELMSKINRFVDKVICESNQQISLIISGYNNDSCYFSLQTINIFQFYSRKFKLVSLEKHFFLWYTIL